MKQLDFNTLDNLANNEELNRVAEQAQEAIKTMQTPMPAGFVPTHVVPPIIQQQMERERLMQQQQQEQQAAATAAPDAADQNAPASSGMAVPPPIPEGN